VSDKQKGVPVFTDGMTVEEVEKRYIETTDFLVGLTVEEQGKLYREAMLGFVYQLSNYSPEPDVMFKRLFSSSIELGAERAGLKTGETNE